MAQQPPTHPRDWAAGIDDYLRNNGIAFKSATPLEGGTSCFLWRIDGLVDAEASANGHKEEDPVVIKCADSVAKLNPDLPVPADRLQVEIKALTSKIVAEASRQEPSVQTPRVLRQTNNGFIMSWGGDLDLRFAYKTNPSLNASAVGARLGKWLAYLHLASITEGPGEWAAESNGLLAQIYHKPGGLEEEVIRSALTDQEEIERVLKVLRKPDPARTLTVWDFRPMNTLLQAHAEGAAAKLTIVDWELCHYGEPSNDLRQWAAEAMVMEAKFGDRGLLSSFLTAYKNNVGPAIVGPDFAYKLAIGVGAFLLFFMPQGAQLWDCTEDEVEPWMKTGIEYIKAGANHDSDWLSRSSLKPLLDGQ
ncbi:hypothetical protein CCHL11_00976 [Colletotrichum chlorophyti]|uniref:Aminoglycoside phosphotransferase domain-containing protein n=1 Tax=Colletotrichum chlorophyti TaxID=708187 RepID=A0A1Q8S7S8_9PEZI|nr:hypothetical protein CCHL11_00976 [Colletotrichum chlorophyti]